MSTNTQSRTEQSKRRKSKKVKVVIDKRFKNMKYVWFPLAALLLFIIGLQMGVYYITFDSQTGNYQTILDGSMWSSFWTALKNF